MHSLKSIVVLAVVIAAAAPPTAAQTPPRGVPSPIEEAYTSGDFAGAIRLADSAIRRDPRDHLALYLRGSAKIELGVRGGDADSVRTGIADARSAIRYEGQQETVYYLPYLYGMANLAALENRPEHAEIAVRIAADIVSRDALKVSDKAAVYYQKGVAERLVGRDDDAAASFAEATRLDPGLLAAHTAAAELLVAKGDTAAAATAFDRLVRRFPDVPLVLNNRGMFKQQTGDLTGAIADFTRALQLDANFFYATTNRGFALMLDGYADAAVADFDASLEAAPGQPAVYGLRGQAKQLAGDLTGAITDHRQAVALAPDSFEARADLGFALLFAGEAAESATSFAAALDLQPEAKQLVPWLTEARRANGEDIPADDPRVAAFLAVDPAERDWVDAVTAFQFGLIRDDQLLESVVDDNPDAARAQRCEAHYFAGAADLRADDEEAAKAHFEAALAEELPLMSAYRGASVAVR